MGGAKPLLLIKRVKTLSEAYAALEKDNVQVAIVEVEDRVNHIHNCTSIIYAKDLLAIQIGRQLELPPLDERPGPALRFRYPGGYYSTIAALEKYYTSKVIA